MNNQDVQRKLLSPFSDSDIEWRLQWVNDESTSGIAVPYVTNRAIQTRLDDVVGIGNWKNEYTPWHSTGKKQSQICGISIYFEDKKEWITKYDGAENSDIESIKGGLSDSMKRAAVQWGIGRYLYLMDSVFIDVELNKKGKPDFAKGQRPKLDVAHQACVDKIFGNDTKSTTPEKNNQNTTAVPVQNTVLSGAKSAPETNSYCVMNFVLHPSAKHGQYTNLQLKDVKGNIIQAFMPGVNPRLIPGAWIENAKISSQMKEGIVFHTLESFEFAVEQAA